MIVLAGFCNEMVCDFLGIIRVESIGLASLVKVVNKRGSALVLRAETDSQHVLSKSARRTAI